MSAPLVTREALEATAGRMEFGLAGRGSLRWAAADIGALLEAARLRMDLSPSRPGRSATV